MSGKSIYFKSEILDALRSVARASEGTERVAHSLMPGDEWQVKAMRAYRQGVNDALAAVAESFGLEAGEDDRGRVDRPAMWRAE